MAAKPHPWSIDAKDFLRQVNPLMAKSNFTDYEKQMGGRRTGGESGDFTPYSDAASNRWFQQDSAPQDVSLKLSDGRTWTPSGHGNGIVFHPKGEVTKGDREDSNGNRADVTNPEDYYEVTGDASKLLGKDNAGQSVTVRYKQVGDQMVPMDEPKYQGYKQGWWENVGKPVAGMAGSAALMYTGVGALGSMTGAGAAAGTAGSAGIGSGTVLGGGAATAGTASGLAGMAGMAPGYAATALNTGALNTGMNLLRGQNIGDSLKGGATSALLSPISGYVGNAVGGGTLGTLAGNTALGGVQGAINGKGFATGARDGFVNGAVSAAGSYIGGQVKGETGSNFAGSAANTITQAGLKGQLGSNTLQSLVNQYASGQLTDLTGLDPTVAKTVVSMAQGKKLDPVGALTQYARSTTNAVGGNALRKATMGNGAVGALTQTGG